MSLLAPARHGLCVLLCVFVGVAAAPRSAALPVFPGAVGFGSDTPAGRGGQIVRVTNLLDDYQNPPVGSLRWAIEKVVGPRVIVFEVAGVIELRRNLTVRTLDGAGEHGYLTIAGQTAPFPGITLKNAGLVVNAQHVLVQHIAIRPGTLQTTEPGWDLTPPDNRDCVRVEPGAGFVGGHVVIDHVSASWATDEMVSVWSDKGSVRDVTFSNCIFAEPILNGGHNKGAHGYGPLSGRNASNVTIARNLMAFNWARNPLVRDATSGAQIVNNLIYRPGVWSNTVVYLAGPGGLPEPITNSVVGNVIYRHPVPFSAFMGQADGTVPLETYTQYYNTGIYAHDDLPSGARLYLADNRLFNPQDSTWYPADGDPWSRTIFRDSPVYPVVRLTADPHAGSGGSDWSAWPAAETEARVLGSAGKFPAHRDPLDNALAAKVVNRTGTFVAFQSDLGADPWEAVRTPVTRPLVTPENPSGDDDGDGYTNLEEWLHQMAAAVESAANRPPVAQAGPDQTVVLRGAPTAFVTLDGTHSFDYDGGDLTWTWTWPGGSATGASPTVLLPPGTTVVTLTVTDPQGATGTDTTAITVEERPPVVAIENTTLAYTGEPRAVTIVTHPEQLAVDVRYNGSAVPPVYPGSYLVTATVTTPGYAESATDVLTILPTVLVRHAPVLNGTVDGSVQVMLPESVTLNSRAAIGTDLLLPGSPTLQINGAPSYAGTVDAAGAAGPASHRVTLNGGAALRHVVRRVDAPAWPAVALPPAPPGTRSVALNSPGASPGDFATLRNLTLNSGAGIVAVPPGSYGIFAANQGTRFQLGIPGATTPAVYALQSLTLNGGSGVDIVGPVELTLANGVTVNGGSLGSAAGGAWLDLRVASGGVTLNSGASVHGAILAPSGSVNLNSNALVRGRVVADGLTVNSGGAISDPADRVPPVVELTAPGAGARVAGTLTLAAAAADESGIADVQFQVDGQDVGYADALAPFAVTWDTLQVADGSHTVTAIARDAAGNLSRSTPVLVTVANAVFDTFEDGDAAGWTPDGGSWGLSAQAGTTMFRQTDMGSVANRSVLTASDWRDQRVEADVRPNAVTGANRFFGVVARYQAPGDYYYFVLRTNNTAELKRLTKGVATNLATPVTLPFAVSPGVTYRLGIEAVGSRLRGYVNGQLILEGADSSYASGRAGLLTYFSDVSFDDVHADPVPDAPVLAVDDFETGLTAAWGATGGEWIMAGRDATHALRQEAAAGEARAVLAAPLGEATLIELDVRVLEFGSLDGAAGFAIRRQDNGDAYLVELRADNTLALVRASGGVRTVLASAPLGRPPGAWVRLGLNTVGTSLKVYADGKPALQAVDATLASGRFALETTSARAEFDELLITAP